MKEVVLFDVDEYYKKRGTSVRVTHIAATNPREERIGS